MSVLNYQVRIGGCSLILEPFTKIPMLTVFGVFKDPRVHIGFQTLRMLFTAFGKKAVNYFKSKPPLGVTANTSYRLKKYDTFWFSGVFKDPKCVLRVNLEVEEVEAPRFKLPNY